MKKRTNTKEALMDLFLLAKNEDVLIVGERFLQQYNDFKKDIKYKFSKNKDVHKLIKRLPRFFMFSRKKLVLVLIIAVIFFRIILNIYFNILDQFAKNLLPLFLTLPIIPIYKSYYNLSIRNKQKRLKVILEKLNNLL